MCCHRLSPTWSLTVSSSAFESLVFSLCLAFNSFYLFLVFPLVIEFWSNTVLKKTHFVMKFQDLGPITLGKIMKTASGFYSSLTAGACLLSVSSTGTSEQNWFIWTIESMQEGGKSKPIKALKTYVPMSPTQNRSNSSPIHPAFVFSPVADASPIGTRSHFLCYIS